MTNHFLSNLIALGEGFTTEFKRTGTSNLGRDERLELPVDALREALVNAIAHRDYRSSANVQLYIFYDRLEIVTPGGLPAGMREEDLGVKSVPRNPLLFGMFYRMGMVEQVGSGIKRIREMCRDYGVAEPVIEVSDNWVTTTFKRPNGQVEDQVADEVTPQVRRLLAVCDGELLREELQERIGLADRKHFRTDYLRPALNAGLIKMTIPDKPTSSKQKYRITEKGKALLTEVEGAQK
jgi:ATP-dependent DNA helicase RecG